MIVGSHSEVTGAPKLDFDSHAAIAPVPRISIQAFCESPDTAAIMQEAIADRRMDKAHVKVHMGGGAAGGVCAACACWGGPTMKPASASGGIVSAPEATR